MLRWAWPAFSAEQVARFPLLLLALGAGALGWSQAKLAREAGFDKRSIIRYELGLVAPPIEVAAKLATALGKSLDHMAGLAPSVSDPETSAIVSKLQQLPPDRRELVKALINVLAEKK